MGMPDAKSPIDLPADLPDNINGVDVSTAKGMLEQIAQDPSKGIVKFEVKTIWKTATRSDSKIESWEIGGHKLPLDFTIPVDDPEQFMGKNEAPNPQQTFLAGFNSCLMVAYVAWASMLGVQLEKLEIESVGELDLRGYFGIDPEVPSGYPELKYKVTVKGNGTKEQFAQIHENVKKFSPNYYNLANAIAMNAEQVVEE